MWMSVTGLSYAPMLHRCGAPDGDGPSAQPDPFAALTETGQGAAAGENQADRRAGLRKAPKP